MSLAITVNLFQGSGLKATEMQHQHHPQKKAVTLEVPVLTFYTEKVLLCFLRRSCFSSPNKFSVICLFH